MGGGFSLRLGAVAPILPVELPLHGVSGLKDNGSLTQLKLELNLGGNNRSRIDIKCLLMGLIFPRDPVVLF